MSTGMNTGPSWSEQIRRKVVFKKDPHADDPRYFLGMALVVVGIQAMVAFSDYIFLVMLNPVVYLLIYVSIYLPAYELVPGMFTLLTLGGALAFQLLWFPRLKKGWVLKGALMGWFWFTPLALLVIVVWKGAAL
jgi:hypothetical protein